MERQFLARVEVSDRKIHTRVSPPSTRRLKCITNESVERVSVTSHEAFVQPQSVPLAGKPVPSVGANNSIRPVVTIESLVNEEQGQPCSTVRAENAVLLFSVPSLTATEIVLTGFGAMVGASKALS